MRRDQPATTIEVDLVEHIALLVSSFAATAVVLHPTGRLIHDLLQARALARAQAPRLFVGTDSLGSEFESVVSFVEENLLWGVCSLGRCGNQAEYEIRYLKLADHLSDLETRLATRRYLMGSNEEDFGYADCLLFAFLVRLEPVFYHLFKATFPIAERPHLFAYARDLWERPELYEKTDPSAINQVCFTGENQLNPSGFVPRGPGPDWHRPHERHLLARASKGASRIRNAEEDRAGFGEWLRGKSQHRHFIAEDPNSEFPAEPGRYHLFAPYNCPWSHRALLARQLKGLTDLVGVSIVYFRRHPERGWQFNDRIPGCTADRVSAEKYLDAYYERIGSKERTAPVLWDQKRQTIVSNESADILRMFNDAFRQFLPEGTLDLRPPQVASLIDELNELIYARLNDGAYKAGFARSQAAYERAFERYFSALDHLERLLCDRDFLCKTSAPTEADVRLFPTVFRHDAIYFSRFKLDKKRISDLPRLSAWLERLLDFPGIQRASNLDHARNGYFGRSTDEIVPLGPMPLGLSPSQFSERVWLNE